ncbi:hypothetical protein SNEBB_001067, partial [Seison nebaliae]
MRFSFLIFTISTVFIGTLAFPRYPINEILPNNLPPINNRLMMRNNPYQSLIKKRSNFNEQINDVEINDLVMEKEKTREALALLLE